MTMRTARAGKQNTQVVVNLCHGSDRGARIMRGRFLVNGDRGRETSNFVDIRFVLELQELTGVTRKGFHVPPLSLGVQRVKCQGGFSRTRETCDHDERILRDVHVNIFQVVNTRAADGNHVFFHRKHEVSERLTYFFLCGKP